MGTMIAMVESVMKIAPITMSIPIDDSFSFYTISLIEWLKHRLTFITHVANTCLIGRNKTNAVVIMTADGKTIDGGNKMESCIWSAARKIGISGLFLIIVSRISSYTSYATPLSLQYIRTLTFSINFWSMYLREGTIMHFKWEQSIQQQRNKTIDLFFYNFKI